MSAADLVVSNEVVLIRDDHPDFLILVEQFLRWAETLPENSDHPLKPSTWFLELLGKWVDEDRRIPMVYYVRPPSKGKHTF